MKRWQFILGLLISAVFLFFALRGLDFQEVWSVLQTAEYFWLLPAILVYFFGLWLRALRWKIFLDPINNIKTGKIFSTVCIGYMGNNIYPARLGELLRAYILKKEEKIAVSTSLATIIIERIFDGIVMLGFILLNLSVVSQMSHSADIRQTIQTVSTWAAILFTVAFILFIFSAVFPDVFSNIFRKFFGILLPKKASKTVQKIINTFFTGVQSLSSPVSTIYALMLTIAIWLLETVFYWIIMLAFPFQVSFGTLMLMNGFLNLFTIIPSSPGYIGTFDAPGIALLSALGIDHQFAAGYTLLLHAVLWLPVTLAGALFFTKKGLSWNIAIKNTTEEPKT